MLDRDMSSHDGAMKQVGLAQFLVVHTPHGAKKSCLSVRVDTTFVVAKLSSCTYTVSVIDLEILYREVL